jgi:hypothetical protein
VIEEADGIDGHLVVGDGEVAPGGAAVAAAVHRHYPVAGADQLGHEIPREVIERCASRGVSHLSAPTCSVPYVRRNLEQADRWLARWGTSKVRDVVVDSYPWRLGSGARERQFLSQAGGA